MEHVTFTIYIDQSSLQVSLYSKTPYALQLYLLPTFNCIFEFEMTKSIFIIAIINFYIIVAKLQDSGILTFTSILNID